MEGVSHSNHHAPLRGHQVHDRITMQNAFSPALTVPINLTISTSFKSPELPEIQGNLLTVTTLNSKSKLHTCNIQWHRIYIPSPNRKNRGIVRKYWIKERLKPSRAATKPCSSCPVSGTFSWGLDGSALRLCCLLYAAFSWAGFMLCMQLSMVSWLCTLQYLGFSLLHPTLHFHSFM